MKNHLQTAGIGVLAAIAMAGVIVSTTDELREMTLISIPNWAQLLGVILIGLLVGFASRTSTIAFVALMIASVVGAFLQGLAIGFAATGMESSNVHLINRATLQGFYALVVIFFMGMTGVVAALLINVMALRIELEE